MLYHSLYTEHLQASCSTRAEKKAEPPDRMDEYALPGPVKEAIEKFKTAFTHRAQDLAKTGMSKEDALTCLIETTLRPTLTPGISDIELVKRHGVFGTQSALNVLAIRSELQKWKSQGLDIPASINEMAKQINKLEPTKKRKREIANDITNTDPNEPLRKCRLSPAARYMERYKKRKADCIPSGDNPETPNKKFRFMNYRDPVLHVPDPISFQFEVNSFLDFQ